MPWLSACVSLKSLKRIKKMPGAENGVQLSLNASKIGINVHLSIHFFILYSFQLSLLGLSFSQVKV